MVNAGLWWLMMAAIWIEIWNQHAHQNYGPMQPALGSNMVIGIPYNKQ